MEKSKFKISGYMWIYLVTALIALAGIILGDYRTIPQGLKNIYFSPALLITDYIALAGPAAAFLNVALVTFFSALLMQLNKLPVNGRYFHVLGLMAGFAFFGKNIFTMWYILLGTSQNILQAVCLLILLVPWWLWRILTMEGFIFPIMWLPWRWELP